jgi:hypothetical protein
MRLLTLEEKELLIDQDFVPDNKFRPVEDINGNWFISEESVNQCINPNFEWVKDLPEAEYIPKPLPFKI